MKNLFLFLTCMGLLSAQDLQELADNLQVAPTLEAHVRQFPMPAVPEGVSIKILGADFKTIIDEQGRIQPVLSDVDVQLCFELSRDGQEAQSKDYELRVQAPQSNTLAPNAKPSVIPALLQWKGAQGSWKMPQSCRVQIAGEDKGLVKEMQAMLGDGYSITQADKGADITLSLNPDKKNLLGEEGYEMKISTQGITLEAATEMGLYWSTRSLLQMLKQDASSIPCGQVRDMPRFALRGFMLDVGRSPIPMYHLYDVVRRMAWYKMNDFQIHLNDNFIFHEKYVDAGQDPFKLSYAGFRLESEHKGADGTMLSSQDVCYSKQEFIDFINYAQSLGVRIVPEFDTPGHALSFTRIRPDLIYQGEMNNPKRRCEMLDAANPETLRFVEGVYDEYLLHDSKLGQAVFQDLPVVHVGADEFYGQAEDYRKYLNGILRHVLERGHTARVWGSLRAKPGTTPVVSKGVQMNMWSHGWSSPWQSIKLGYDIINTNDGDLYIVPLANYYRMDKNHQGIYENWIPNRISDETVPAGHPQFLGSMFAVWNDEIDLLHHGQSYDDIAPLVDGSIDVLSQKMWGLKAAPMSFEQHRALVSMVEHDSVDAEQKKSDVFHASDSNPEFPSKLGEGTLKPPYHLCIQMTLNPSSEGKEQILLQSADGSTFYAAMKDGSIGFRRDDSLEFSLGARLPLGKSVTLEVIGELGSTKILIDGKVVESKPKLLSVKTTCQDILTTFRMPLALPVQQIDGKVHTIEVNPAK